MRTAEEKRNQKAKREEQEVQRKAEIEKDKVVVDAVLKTECGRDLFKWLFKECGYNKTTLAVALDGSGIQFNSTVHNEARRRVYISLRELATPELLAPVELAAEKVARI